MSLVVIELGVYDNGVGSLRLRTPLDGTGVAGAGGCDGGLGGGPGRAGRVELGGVDGANEVFIGSVGDVDVSGSAGSSGEVGGRSGYNDGKLGLLEGGVCKSLRSQSSLGAGVHGIVDGLQTSSNVISGASVEGVSSVEVMR